MFTFGMDPLFDSRHVMNWDRVSGHLTSERVRHVHDHHLTVDDARVAMSDLIPCCVDSRATTTGQSRRDAARYIDCYPGTHLLVRD